MQSYKTSLEKLVEAFEVHEIKTTGIPAITITVDSPKQTPAITIATSPLLIETTPIETGLISPLSLSSLELSDSEDEETVSQASWADEKTDKTRILKLKHEMLSLVTECEEKKIDLFNYVQLNPVSIKSQIQKSYHLGQILNLISADKYESAMALLGIGYVFLNKIIPNAEELFHAWNAINGYEKKQAFINSFLKIILFNKINITHARRETLKLTGVSDEVDAMLAHAFFLEMKAPRFSQPISIFKPAEPIPPVQPPVTAVIAANPVTTVALPPKPKYNPRYFMANGRRTFTPLPKARNKDLDNPWLQKVSLE